MVTKTTTPKAETKKHESKGLLALVRVRGAPKMSTEIRLTLDLMHLPTRHSCVIVTDSQGMRGMIRKVNSFITWGEADDELIKQLEAKAKSPKKHQFLLQSPKKGFETKGIKLPNSAKGALGYRGKSISKLITRMI